MMRSTLSRAVAVVTATALAGLGVSLTAAPAEAHLVLQPRTYTAVMTPTSAVPGVATAYSVVVRNTSTRISALDRFTLSIPTGFTVTPGTVTAPRGGWTETVGGSLLTARTAQPLRYALRKGESMTVRFTATATDPCGGLTATWAQKADGIIIDPFVAQSPDPTVAVAGANWSFHVTSVTDVNDQLTGDQVLVDEPFTVAGEFRCGGAVVPAGSAGTVSLDNPPGPGSLGGTTSTTVAATATTATIAGATYDTVANAVDIDVEWSGSALVPDDSFDLDVLGDVATTNGEPGIPASLDVQGESTGAEAVLSQGANGPVTLVVESCAGDPTPTPEGEETCRFGTQFELTANLKDGEGTPLYSFEVPAKITWFCPGTVCRHQYPGSEGTEGEPYPNYDYNYDCDYYSNCGGDFAEREVEEDFAWHPVYLSIIKDGVEQPFARAGRCVPLPTEETDYYERDRLLHQTGVIEDPAAQEAGFCVDVNAIDRSGNSFTGDLTIPVLFVEDLKLRP